MHALDVLGDPVRRRILELLTDGEASAGAIATVISDEFGISQPAVSQHLRVLREQGFATVRPDGQRRLYAVDAAGPREARAWLSAFDGFWMPQLAARDTEPARGRRQRQLRERVEAARAAARDARQPAGAPGTTEAAGAPGAPEAPGAPGAAVTPGDDAATAHQQADATDDISSGTNTTAE